MTESTCLLFGLGPIATCRDWLGQRPVGRLISGTIMPLFVTDIGGMLLFSAAHAIPPPPLQSVANCTDPTYASDMLVCTSAELLELDHQVRDALVAAGS